MWPGSQPYCQLGTELLQGSQVIHENVCVLVQDCVKGGFSQMHATLTFPVQVDPLQLVLTMQGRAITSHHAQVMGAGVTIILCVLAHHSDDWG